MQLHVSLNPTDSGTLSDTGSCASDVSRWFIENALLLNPRPRLKLWLLYYKPSAGVSSQQVTGRVCHMQFTDAVKLLAVTLDSTLSVDKHIVDNESK